MNNIYIISDFINLHTLHTLSIYLIDFQTNELVYAAM